VRRHCARKKKRSKATKGTGVRKTTGRIQKNQALKKNTILLLLKKRRVGESISRRILLLKTADAACGTNPPVREKKEARRKKEISKKGIAKPRIVREKRKKKGANPGNTLQIKRCGGQP